MRELKVKSFALEKNADGVESGKRRVDMDMDMDMDMNINVDVDEDDDEDEDEDEDGGYGCVSIQCGGAWPVAVADDAKKACVYTAFL